MIEWLSPAKWLQKGMATAVNLVNLQRQRFQDMDYVFLNLPTRMPALPDHANLFIQRLLGKTVFSLAELEQQFKKIGGDSRLRGVVLYLRKLELGAADLQTLREIIWKLRLSGKRVICYAHALDTRSYYVASAASEIILQEGGELRPVGFRTSAVFMKDALDSIGVQADIVAISPYKSAADFMTRSEISPEGRAQIDWLLDSQYEVMINSIADGRHISAAETRRLVDSAPYNDHEALAAKHVDGVLNEEALAAYLGAHHLITWEKAAKYLPLRWQGNPEKVVTVLRVGGMIVEGESMKPPVDMPVPLFGGERMGNITVVQQIRKIAADKRTAALVLFVDSPGGSASASEAIASALEQLAKKIPVVVFMNNVAASGGYYISTPAQWIVAQPLTITGSIGVLGGKIINSELWKKMRFNVVEFLRGDNAALESPSTLYSEAHRQKVRASIERTYEQFIARVAKSRHMTVEQVDVISGGRVWSGEQALQHGLVDAVGGLSLAIDKARELAKLSKETPAVLFRGRTRPMVPQLAERVNPAAGLFYLRDSIEMVFDGRVQMLMPVMWQ